MRDEKNKMIGSGAQALPDLANMQTIVGKVQPLAQTGALRLHLTLVTPMGSIAAEDSVDWQSSDAGAKPSANSSAAPAKY